MCQALAPSPQKPSGLRHGLAAPFCRGRRDSWGRACWGRCGIGAWRGGRRALFRGLRTLLAGRMLGHTAMTIIAAPTTMSDVHNTVIGGD